MKTQHPDSKMSELPVHLQPYAQAFSVESYSQFYGPPRQYVPLLHKNNNSIQNPVGSNVSSPHMGLMSAAMFGPQQKSYFNSSHMQYMPYMTKPAAYSGSFSVQPPANMSKSTVQPLVQSSQVQVQSSVHAIQFQPSVQTFNQLMHNSPTKQVEYMYFGSINI